MHNIAQAVNHSPIIQRNKRALRNVTVIDNHSVNINVTASEKCYQYKNGKVTNKEKMDVNMELLLSKLEEKLQQQTLTITTAVTKNVMDALEQKIAPIIEENRNLKIKIDKLEQKFNIMEKEKRKFNLIFFGTDEKGKSEMELVDYLKEIIAKTGTCINSDEISNIYRIRSNTSKSQPVVITLSTIWKKHIILKNKKKLPSGIYINEDYPREVLEIRKQLQPKVDEERKNGNIAFIKYDKLIIKSPNDNNRDKRKREHSNSPNASTQKKLNTNTDGVANNTNLFTKQVIKPNILNYVTRGRTASLSETSKNN